MADKKDDKKPKLKIVGGTQKEFKSTRQKEQPLRNTITEKYGPGQLDPATGVFTPTPVEDTKEVQTQTLE